MRLTRPLLVLALLATSFEPALARGSSGAYLAARQAGIDNNFPKAAEYYRQALSLDASNPALMENTILANVSMGWVDRAVPIAERMHASDIKSHVSEMVRLGGQIEAGAYDAILEEFESGREVGPLIDGLVTAWAELGAGRVSEALDAFDAVSDESGLKSFALYHKALALASVGDLEGADDVFSGRAAGPITASRRGVAAHAQILSQLDRPEDAVELIRTTFGNNPAPIFRDMLTRLDGGETLEFDIVRSPKEGLAEVFLSVAGALFGEAADGYTLIYTRMAEYLDPDDVDSVLLTASLLEGLGQYELATRSYDKVPPQDPSFVSAEMGRADALESAGNSEASIEVLNQLSKSHPDLYTVHTALGDALRRLERYQEATPAYDKAVSLIDEPVAQHWVVHFSRGITLERTDRWDEAEADFRRALELQPDQPQVLNYLGYSLVELQIKFDEALDMIERAVAGRPDDGYITDSLGWVLYRLGRYDEAVGHMERAAELMPVDPIINDHLGDVYWAVGRELEARFQWRRALSFDPEEDEALRIRRKLEVGLDAVLEEEGADPITVANDKG